MVENAPILLADEAPDSRSGAQIIQGLVRRLPSDPGVYRMLDASGTVLYVGKARNLKNRVSNYTRPAGQPNRIARMIFHTRSMEFIVTKTETEALLLEANLIKRLRPRYNVLLRDDKSFPYILLTGDHDAPMLVKHRGARKRKGKYFGPFASASAVDRTINTLQRAFLLRTCTDSSYDSRTRPCLLHQIKRCAAPCTGVISLTDYGELVEQATGFLTGKSQDIKADLATAMEAASAELDFERAAIYRDRLAALSHVQAHQGINPATLSEADVFAASQIGGQTCIQVFFFRAGQNMGNRAFFPKADAEQPVEEVLQAFVLQFYDDKPIAKTVLVSHPLEEQALMAEAFTERLGRKVQINVPLRGERKDLMDHARSNAKDALERRLTETASQTQLLESVAEVFGLDEPPERIEVYDNSHIMGTNQVGCMIVAGVDGFIKNQYRKFNIKNKDLAPGDDYGMMKEVLGRRFARLIKETDGKGSGSDQTKDGVRAWPDLLLIDGGKGQLSATMQVLDELGVKNVPVVGVAKGVDRDAGREQFFLPKGKPFRLPPKDPALYFIQRLRDEAHRFAIGTHRARRKSDLKRNPLDEIAGVGAVRKRALLHHFGTAKAVSRAGLSDLKSCPGISDQIAKLVYDHFHE